MKNEKDMMLQMAECYENNEEVQKEWDIQFGKGVAGFLADAIRVFYKG